MATAHHSLSDFDYKDVPNAKGWRFGIVVSEWNSEVTSKLQEGAIRTLIKFGASKNSIIVNYVPGAFELPLGCKFMISSEKPDAVIAIGCVIQGETKHFDYICDSVASGITRLNLDHSVPVIFGVLTTDNLEQALDRAGGKHGNKGDEAAVSAIKMVQLAQNSTELPF